MNMENEIDRGRSSNPIRSRILEAIGDGESVTQDSSRIPLMLDYYRGDGTVRIAELSGGFIFEEGTFLTYEIDGGGLLFYKYGFSRKVQNEKGN